MRQRYYKPGFQPRVSALMFLSWSIFLIDSILNIAFYSLNLGFGGFIGLLTAIIALGIPSAIFLRQAHLSWKAGSSTPQLHRQKARKHGLNPDCRYAYFQRNY
jgi:hypothetical protein